jgi:hypothetical protein
LLAAREALQPKPKALCPGPSKRLTSHLEPALACCTNKSNRLRRRENLGTICLDAGSLNINTRKKEKKKRKTNSFASSPIFLYTRFFRSSPSIRHRAYCIHCIIIITIIMANPNAGHFFQTSESLVAEQRKASKAQNKLGRPIKLSSKLLAVTADPFDERAVYVAEAAGEVRRVVLEVSSWHYFLSFLHKITRDMLGDLMEQ